MGGRGVKREKRVWEIIPSFCRAGRWCNILSMYRIDLPRGVPELSGLQVSLTLATLLRQDIFFIG